MFQTMRVMESPLPTLALAVLYTILFVASWEPDTFRLIMNPDFYFLPQVRAVAAVGDVCSGLCHATGHVIACIRFNHPTSLPRRERGKSPTLSSVEPMGAGWGPILTRACDV